MKQLLACIALCGVAFAQLGSTRVEGGDVSVADAAKASRASKTSAAKKVYTDEDLPSAASEDARHPAPRKLTLDADPVSAQARLDAEWHHRIDRQKAHIEDLQEQLKEAEARLAHVTHFYEVNPNPRYEKYKEKADALRGQIEDAKKTLADLQEQAHKAGVNQAYD